MAKSKNKKGKKFIYSCRKDPVDNRDYRFKAYPDYEKLKAVRPAVVDWTSSMSGVRDQGNLGSCVGFALTAMKEYQEVHERVVSNEQYGPSIDELKDLSEAWVYWKAKAIDPDPEEGTTIKYGMMVLKDKGVPLATFCCYMEEIINLQ